MDVHSGNGDPRVKITGLLTLTWGHAVANDAGILLLVATSLVVVLIYWEYFLRSLSVILITGLFLCFLSLLAWFTTKNISFPDLLLNFSKWLSMSVVSLTLFSSLNALEFIVALRWLKVPSRIALAMGISLRFFPVIVDQGSRLLTIQRLRLGTNPRRGRAQRLFKIVEGAVPSLFISVLRQIENITLSVLIQDLERRVASYRIPTLGKIDFLLIVLLILLPGYIIASSLTRH